MRSLWWKILAAIIFLYVIIVGLCTPMKPGFTGDVVPFLHKAGDKAKFSVTGYNTHFTQPDTKAWLKLDSSSVIEIDVIKATSDVDAIFSVQLPTYLPTKDSTLDATLLVSNSLDGTAILPGALFITQANIDPSVKSYNNISNIDFPRYEGFAFPFRSTLHETVRNTFFHVAIWFAMYTLLIIGLIYSIKYLIKPNMRNDIIASSFTEVGVLLGFLGIFTGSVWARFTWGAFWTPDVKLNTAASFILIYSAYLVLRASMPDQDRRAKVSAAYNIFAFATMVPLIIIIPRLTDSLHPGSGGNPALGGEDLDHTLRMVFYPSIIALTLLSVWISSLVTRLRLLKDVYMSRR